MTWWKFWTWHRRDDADGSNTTRREFGQTDFEIYDDILISISGLIDNQQDDLVDFIRTTRTTELSTAVESVAGAQSIVGVKPTETVAGTETTEASGTTGQKIVNPSLAPVETISRFASERPAAIAVPMPERRPASLTEPVKSPTTVREHGPLSRDVARKDPRKTLVAEDGQWPTFKGLSGSFKDLDDADDETSDSNEFDGPSPFQTIVPNDD